MLLEAAEPVRSRTATPRGVGRHAAGGRAARSSRSSAPTARARARWSNADRRPARRALRRAAPATASISARCRRAPGVPPRHRPGAGGAPVVHRGCRWRKISRWAATGRGAPAPRRHAGPRGYRLFPILSERRRQLSRLALGRPAADGGHRPRCSWPGPRLLLLDEPSLGLAPTIVEQMFRIIRTDSRRGRGHPARRAERPAGAGHRRPCLRARGGPGGGRRPAVNRCGSSRASSGRILACAAGTTSTVEGRQEMSVIKVRGPRVRAPAGARPRRSWRSSSPTSG